jgi:hypothetical protein
VTAAAAVHAVGRAQGGDDPFGRTLGHAALATLPALGLMMGATLVAMGSAWDGEGDPEGALFVVAVGAAVAFLVLPPVYAAHRYGRAPSPRLALARAPEGGLVPVAAFTLSL